MPFAAVGGRMRFWLLFGGIWFLVGAVLAIVFSVVGGPIWDDWILDARGVQATAQALGVERTSATRDNWRRIYTIRFRFRDLDGEPHEARGGTTDASLIGKARERETIAIEYDPLAPGERVRLVGHTASWFGNLIFLPISFSLAGLVLALVGYGGVRRNRAVYRDGEVVEATVVTVTPTTMRINRRRVMLVQYLFRLPTGVVRGKWRTADPPAVEDTMWVIYDPQRPERNVVVPP